jgi:S1-C subfamily serine protease
MRISSVCSAGLLLILALPSAEADPSFDCRKARYPDEFAICNSPDLAELDNIIAAGYAYLKTRFGRPYADEIGIPAWRMRQSCQSDTYCIRQRQIQAVRAYQVAGAPVSLPGWVNSEETQSPPASPPLAPPSQAENSSPPTAREVSSGTGFYLNKDGFLLTNAHVVEDCATIRVEIRPGKLVPATLSARDTANDLALLRTDTSPAYAAAFRFGPRLGEPVEAFGYPLTNILATSGNFTLGNITALAGLGDDSRYLQISVPVQPGKLGWTLA